MKRGKLLIATAVVSACMSITWPEHGSHKKTDNGNI